MTDNTEVWTDLPALDTWPELLTYIIRSCDCNYVYRASESRKSDHFIRHRLHVDKDQNEREEVKIYLNHQCQGPDGAKDKENYLAAVALLCDVALAMLVVMRQELKADARKGKIKAAEYLELAALLNRAELILRNAAQGSVSALTASREEVLRPF